MGFPVEPKPVLDGDDDGSVISSASSFPELKLVTKLGCRGVFLDPVPSLARAGVEGWVATAERLRGSQVEVLLQLSPLRPVIVFDLHVVPTHR